MPPKKTRNKKLNSKKPAKCSYDFPLELLAGVLVRVPVKTLLKFRCVCKEWKSLIDSPDFASFHLQFNKFNSKIANLFLIEGKSASPQCSVRGSDTFRRICRFDSPQSIFDSEFMIYLNGLLLYSKFNEERLGLGFVIWNPSIRKSIEIPPPPSLSDTREIRVGFGYNAVAMDYKVVVIICKETPWRDCPPPKPLCCPFPVLVDVYSLKTRSWRSSRFETNCVKSLRFRDATAFVNSAIHWIGCDVTMVPYPLYGSHVVAFNVQNEVFNYFRVPDGRAVHRSRVLGVLGESLVLLDMFPGCSLIWVMEQYGVAESWVNLYNIDLEYDKFLYFKRSGQLLVTVKKEGVKEYDIESRETKDLAKTFRNDVLYMTTLVESLVLVGD